MNFQFYLIRRSIICQGGRKNRTGESLRCGLVQVSVSSSACQTLTQASDGMRQSPLGESVTEPTFGPSGMQERLNCFRDLIAYRIVISMPKCHLKNPEDGEREEIRYLYEIANVLKGFLEERGFTAESAGGVKESDSLLLSDAVRPYYRDYIAHVDPDGYRSLHITFFDNSAKCYMEMQLRTKRMDDIAEIGSANHLGYEKKQESDRARRDAIPEGECVYFDEAYERCRRLHELELAKLDVNMFAAIDNSLINDGCGLYRGRLILPYEHLSRFQNDLID